MFYDSFLNCTYCKWLPTLIAFLVISDKEERTSLSSRGYALGYMGGGLFLGVNMGFYTLFGGNLTIRIIMAAGGLWWFGWSLVTFKYLRYYWLCDTPHLHN